MIKDRNVHYKYKREFFAAGNFNCYAGTATSTTNSAAGGGGTNPVLAEVDNDHYGALTLTADDEFGRIVMTMPSHWDLDNHIFLRAIYAEADGAQSVDIDFRFRQLAFGGTAIDNDPAGDTTAISTQPAVDTSTGSEAIDATTWGKIDGGTLKSSNDILVLDTVGANAGTNEIFLIGTEVAYLPKLTDGAQNKLTADPTDA